MNFSINTGDFRVILGPPIVKAVSELDGSASVVGCDRREVVRFLDAKMPWWRETVILVEELFDRKKGVWREITFEYRKSKRPNVEHQRVPEGTPLHGPVGHLAEEEDGHP